MLETCRDSLSTVEDKIGSIDDIKDKNFV